jgi:hypothetical protein
MHSMVAASLGFDRLGGEKAQPVAAA